MVELRALLTAIEARKAQLGIRSTAAETEAMRNKGGSRTLQKRLLLRRIQQRAKAANHNPVAAHF